MSVQTANLNSLNAQLVVTADVATLPSIGSVGVQIGGNWAGTISFFGSIDGTNPFAVLAYPITSIGGNPTASTPVNGQFAIPVYGFNQVIIKMTSYSAGTAVVSVDATVSALPILTITSVQVAQDNQGGPPLASGVSPAQSLGLGVDVVNVFQGQGTARMQLVATLAGDTQLVFTDNPWTQGLDVNDRILLCSGVNGKAREEVPVSPNNTPAIGAGPVTVVLASPVVYGGSNFGCFDNFQVDGPKNDGATVVGTVNEIVMLYDANSTDPKIPLKPLNQARNAPGVAAMMEVEDPSGSSPTFMMRDFLEAILKELRIQNFMIAQLKDPGGMEVPASVSSPDTVGLTS